MPLADTYRPQSFNDMVGQQHLVGPHGVLRHLANTKTAQSIIMYGPPGLGKTTSARILAKALGRPLFELNATTASTSDIRKIADSAPDDGCVLYLDEIQYFNKKQQQSLLSFVESGESGVITLLASTTENPYHGIYDALLSRCMILEFKKPSADEIASRVIKAANDPQTPIYRLNKQICHYISKIASGDVRRALNTAEMVCSLSDNPKSVTMDDVKRILPTAVMVLRCRNPSAAPTPTQRYSGWQSFLKAATSSVQSADSQPSAAKTSVWHTLTLSSIPWHAVRRLNPSDYLKHTSL